MNRFAIFLLILHLSIDFSLAQDSSINGSTSSSIPISLSTTAAPSSILATTTTTSGQSTPSISTTNVGSSNGAGGSTSSSSSAAASSTPQSMETTTGQNQATNRPVPPAPSSSTQGPATVDPSVGQAIVSDLVRNLVPSVGVGGAGAGAGGLLPAISRLSGPLAQIIQSNGTPTADSVNQILREVPNMAVMASMSKMAGAGAKSGAGAGSSSVGGQAVSASSFSNMTQQQINDLVSGAAPLPPMSFLPQEYIDTVMSGGVLPGLTMEQTQALKSRYMAEMFGGGGGGLDSLFGQSSNPVAVSPSNGSIGGNQSISSGKSINTNQSISTNVTNQKSIFADSNLLQELQTLDLSRLPPDVLQGFLKGESIDLAKIPQDFLQNLIYKSPQLFAKIVHSELQKKIANQSIGALNNSGLIIKGGSPKSIDQQQGFGQSIPYDVNSLDRKADISMYHQGKDSDQIFMYTVIVLGIVGFLTALLIGILCWRRQRKLRLANEAATARHGIVEEV